VIQPGLIQLRRVVDLTPERAREQASTILRTVERRLAI
jgi:hypothetical protein